MKKLTIHTINYLRSGYEENDITPEDYISSITEYNGNIVTENIYNPDATLQSAIVTEYDDNSHPVLVKNYDGVGVLCEQLSYVYVDGVLMEQKVSYGEDMPEYVTRMVYENGLLVRRDCYDEDEFSYMERELSYDEKGQLVKDVEYDEDGNVLYVTVNQYDEKGQLIGRVRDEIQQKDRRSVSFEYDENGNKVKDLIYNYDEMLIAKTYYHYDADNRLVDEEEEDLDHYRKSCYEYEGGRLSKISLLDKDGNLLSWTAYTYDAEGRILTQDSYASDEVNPAVCRLVNHVDYTRE